MHYLQGLQRKKKSEDFFLRQEKKQRVRVLQIFFGIIFGFGHKCHTNPYDVSGSKTRTAKAKTGGAQNELELKKVGPACPS